jgi:hypothetical protein
MSIGTTKIWPGLKRLNEVLNMVVKDYGLSDKHEFTQVAYS